MIEGFSVWGFSFFRVRGLQGVVIEGFSGMFFFPYNTETLILKP